MLPLTQVYHINCVSQQRWTIILEEKLPICQIFSLSPSLLPSLAFPHSFLALLCEWCLWEGGGKAPHTAAASLSTTLNHKEQITGASAVTPLSAPSLPPRLDGWMTSPFSTPVLGFGRFPLPAPILLRSAYCVYVCVCVVGWGGGGGGLEAGLPVLRGKVWLHRQTTRCLLLQKAFLEMLLSKPLQNLCFKQGSVELLCVKYPTLNPLQMWNEVCHG